MRTDTTMRTRSGSKTQLFWLFCLWPRSLTHFATFRLSVYCLADTTLQCEYKVISWLIAYWYFYSTQIDEFGLKMLSFCPSETATVNQFMSEKRAQIACVLISDFVTYCDHGITLLPIGKMIEFRGTPWVQMEGS